MSTLSCYTGLRAKIPIFLRYRQLVVGGVSMYEKGQRHKYCFKSLQTCLRHAIFYIDRHDEVQGDN